MSRQQFNPIALVFGTVGLVAVTAGLGYNERNYQRRTADLDWAEKHVHSLDAETVDSSADGGFVHLTGPLEADGRRIDPLFDVETSAVKLVRDVEQLIQKDTADPENSLTWRSHDSSDESSSTYGITWIPPHLNGAITTASFGADGPTVGAYTLSDEMVERMEGERIPLESDVLEGVPSPIREKASLIETDDGDDAICFPNSRHSDSCGGTAGDLRVTWRTFEQGPVSVYGGLRDTRIEPFEGDFLEDPLARISSGRHAPEAMLDATRADARLTLWGFRLLGAMGALFFAFAFFMSLRQARWNISLIRWVDRGSRAFAAAVFSSLALVITVAAMGWVIGLAI